MKSADYQRRLESVLAAHAKSQKAAKVPILHRSPHAVSALAGAIAVFFVLKAAALATTGQPFVESPTEEHSMGAQILYWFAGADPITLALASAMRPHLPTSSQSVSQLAAP